MAAARRRVIGCDGPLDPPASLAGRQRPLAASRRRGGVTDPTPRRSQLAQFLPRRVNWLCLPGLLRYV